MAFLLGTLLIPCLCICVYISYHTHILSHHTHTQTHTISHHARNAVPNVQMVNYCRRICSLDAVHWLLTKHHSHKWRFFQICWVLFQSPDWILGISNLHILFFVYNPSLNCNILLWMRMQVLLRNIW